MSKPKKSQPTCTRESNLAQALYFATILHMHIFYYYSFSLYFITLVFMAQCCSRTFRIDKW